MSKRWLGILIIGAVLLLATSTIAFYALNIIGDSSEVETKNAIKEAAEEDNQLDFIPRQNLDPSLIGARDINFLFFGDMMLDRHVGERLKNKHVGFLLDGLAGEDKIFFSGFDIIGANLEGAVTDGGAHYSPQNAYDFAFSPDRIAELKDFGFNYFTLANNHFSDQGVKGVEETRKNLQALDFYFSGAPDAQIDEYSRQDMEISGQKVSLIGLSMVYAHFDLEVATELVKAAASTTDLVVINIHWGTEYEHQFNRYQQDIGHALVEAGADIIIGHHPHVVQGMEVYQGKPIFYSLGNFIFDQYFSSDTQESLAVKLNVGVSTTTIHFVPLRSTASAPRLLDDKERENFFQKYLTWSKLNENEEGAVSGGLLELAR